MPVEKWSDNVIVARLADDPNLAEDLDALDAATTSRQGGAVSAVVDFTAVKFVNSSTLARMLKVRKQTQAAGGRVVLCGLSDQVWGAFLVTNLDKLFEFSDSVAMALATLQMNAAPRQQK